MPSLKKTIICIGGPTASGKSHLALSLASHIKGELINADSMQIYKGLPILSAQPSLTEQQTIPHHLYAHVSSQATYNTAQWVQDVTHVVETLPVHQTPLIVGGTGLYFKALQDGLSAVPPTPDAMRQQVRTLIQQEELDAAYQQLCTLAPETKTLLHPNDRQRITRALEVVIATGTPLYEWQKKSSGQGERYHSLTILLMPPRDKLLERIEKRIHTMIATGAIDEVENLLSTSIPISPTMEKTLGFLEIKAYLEKSLSKEKMIVQLTIKTRQYAKRQMTWFRNQWQPTITYTHFGDEITPSILQKDLTPHLKYDVWR